MAHSLQNLYQTSRRTFAERYDPHEATAIAFALLEDLYGATRTDILMDRTITLTDEEYATFEEKVRQIARGVPLQHATGRSLFCGRYFKVTPDTLIPRPETEGLLTLINSASPEGGTSGVTVLDCGTGSGCIAITAALAHPEWRVEAWDISEPALAVAQQNAQTLGAKNISFLHKDILAEAANLTTLHQPQDAPRQAPLQPALNAPHYSAAAPQPSPVSLIVSNPPYICQREAAEMEAHVLDHEPHSALFVPDSDPLLFYRALAQIARVRLLPGGRLIVECNRAYTTDTAVLFRTHGLIDTEIIADCFGAPRFVKATAPTPK